MRPMETEILLLLGLFAGLSHLISRWAGQDFEEKGVVPAAHFSFATNTVGAWMLLDR